jgi:thiamine biosynthesis lipoprotein ApbE
MTADALASAVCVLGPEAGLALLERLRGAEGRIVADEGAVQFATSGFARRLAARE